MWESLKSHLHQSGFLFIWCFYVTILCVTICNLTEKFIFLTKIIKLCSDRQHEVQDFSFNSVVSIACNDVIMRISAYWLKLLELPGVFSVFDCDYIYIFLKSHREVEMVFSFHKCIVSQLTLYRTIIVHILETEKFTSQVYWKDNNGFFSS